MKRILLVLVTVLALQACSARITAEEDEKLDNYEKECFAETGVDKKSVEKQLEDTLDIDKILAENDKMKQYFVCLYTKMGLIDADGKVQKSALKRGLSFDISDEAKVDKVVDKCAVQKDAAWKTASEMRKCIKKELSALN